MSVDAEAFQIVREYEIVIQSRASSPQNQSYDITPRLLYGPA